MLVVGGQHEGMNEVTIAGLNTCDTLSTTTLSRVIGKRSALDVTAFGQRDNGFFIRNEVFNINGIRISHKQLRLTRCRISFP